MTSNKPAIHVLEIPQNFDCCLRQALLELGSADLRQRRCLILFYFYFIFIVFLSLVIKLLLAGGDHIPFGSSLYVLQIGNHHLGAVSAFCH